MVIKKKDAKDESGSVGKILDYPMDGSPVGVSYQEYPPGRAPEKGSWVNTICWEAYYILAGTGKIFIDDTEFSVEVGDVVIIKPNQKTYLVSDNLKFITITNPDFYMEQFKEVE